MIYRIATIAAAIDHNGDWCAYGALGVTESDAMKTATETLRPGEHRFLITVKLPLPEPPTETTKVTELNATVRLLCD